MNRQAIFALAATVLLAASASAGTYSGGDGSPENPYRIATAADMQAIGANPDDWNAHFLLTADVNLAEYTGTQFNIIGDGEAGEPFTGVFDGNGHMISKFTYNTSILNYVGLFGYVWYGGQIRNLGFVAANVNGDDYVGGLVAKNKGAIIDCSVIGNVHGRYYVGGLVGYNDGTITNCYAAAEVQGNLHVGGLVGSSPTYGIIGNCYATGGVSGVGDAWYIGGLVGSNNTLATITNCYAIGEVQGNLDVGGLVGYNNQGSISASFWDTETSGTSDGVGNQDPDPAGVAGKTTAEMQTESTYTAADWDFVGDDKPSDDWGMPDVGGYPVLWWQLDSLPDLPTFSGGLGTAENPYIISDANGLNNIGHNPRLMGQYFELTDDINLNDTNFYIIGNPGYSFTGVFDGNGHIISNLTYTNPRAICVGLFSSLGNSGQIKNLGIVDVNAGGYKRVGGLLGQNTFGSITNCYVKGSITCGDDSGTVGGLVGKNDGRITDCYTNVRLITNSYAIGSISGEDVFVGAGGLVGSNYYGTVYDCYAIGSITGSARLGGLIGDNDSGIISNCFASGEVLGDNVLGGLVGFNDEGGTITNCYATGEVHGDNIVGGLVGRNWGSVSNCYISGLVDGNDNTGGLLGSQGLGASISASFWDIDTSGTNDGVGNQDPDPAGVAGKTTVDMQTKSTFTDAGWDFVGESINGMEDIWRLCSAGTDYPKLAWELLLADFVCPDGVEINDLVVLVEQWLLEKLSADVWPDGGDGVVNFSDWAIFADGWQSTTDIDDLATFADQWLQLGAYCADIAPDGGDGVVNMLDFAVFANYWFEGVE